MWAEAVGPYIVAVTGSLVVATSLIMARSERVQRAVEMPKDPTLRDRDEQWIQERARAVATAELAVLTLRERRGPGRRRTGEAWLRAQLDGLGSP